LGAGYGVLRAPGCGSIRSNNGRNVG